jgi:drug/metabolite transporter superfamily protein YnfA
LLPFALSLGLRGLNPTLMQSVVGRTYAALTSIFYLVVLTIVVWCRTQDIWIDLS